MYATINSCRVLEICVKFTKLYFLLTRRGLGQFTQNFQFLVLLATFANILIAKDFNRSINFAAAAAAERARTRDSSDGVLLVKFRNFTRQH